MMRPSRATRSSGRRSRQHRRRLAQQHRQHPPRGGARRRRDRGGGPAAVRRRARRETRCRRCARVIVLGRAGRAPRRRPAPAPCRCRCRCPARWTAPRPSRRACTRTSQAALICTLAPQIDCAMPRPRLTGPASAPGAMPPLPADALRAEAPFLAPHRARVDAVAQCQRIEAELLGQFVDRLLQRERARRVARPAHRAAGAGIDEHVVLRGFEVGAGVQRLRRRCRRRRRAPRRRCHSSAARSRSASRRAARRCASAARSPGGCRQSICSSSPVEHQPHRRARLARQHDGDAAIVAERAISSRTRRPCRRRSRAPG